MEKERAEIRERQESLHRDATALAHEEALMWQELNEMHFHEETFSTLRDSARARIEGIELKSAAIQHAAILTDLFAIGHNGPYATINGFRVGQMAAAPVEWNEINAGLGEAALLLQTLANSVGLEFAEYDERWRHAAFLTGSPLTRVGVRLSGDESAAPSFKIVPLGSFSKVVRVTNLRMEYSLYVVRLPSCQWLSAHLPPLVAHSLQTRVGPGQLRRVALQPGPWRVDHVSPAASRDRRER